MKGSLVLLSSLLSIASSQGPGDGDHHRIPFNRGVAGTTWCDDFQQGIDATVGCDNEKDKVFDPRELEDAKAYCYGREDCIGVTMHPNGAGLTPRCGKVLTEGILDTVFWLNKDGCFSGNTWCDDFQQGIDGTVGCDNGVDKVFSEPKGAKLYCYRNKKCIGVTKHPNGAGFTPRCGEVLTQDIPDTVSWLNKDGCFPLA